MFHAVCLNNDVFSNNQESQSLIDFSGSLPLGSSPHLKGTGVPRCIVSENAEFAFLFIMSTNKETTVVVIQESTIIFAE